jgi:hypothetical protein
MRALDDHKRPRRRMLVALAVVAATTLLTAAPAVAGRDGSKSETALTAYKRFAFEFELAVATPDEDPAFRLATNGVYVKPNSQDCEVTASFGSLIGFTQRSVVVGKKTWFDDNGRGLKPADRRDYDFESQCPSSAEFWEGFPFNDLPPNVHGTAETRGGIAAERLDVTGIFDSVFSSGLVDDLPSDVTAERAVLWRAKHDGVVVALDMALRANSSDTCREVLELDPGVTAPATCLMTIRFDLSRFDDRTIEVRGGSGSKGSLNRT